MNSLKCYQSKVLLKKFRCFSTENVLVFLNEKHKRKPPYLVTVIGRCVHLIISYLPVTVSS